MAKEKRAVKFDKPPVHVTATGSLSVTAEDIFNSKAGQDIILRMTTIRPASSIVRSREPTPPPKVNASVRTHGDKD